MCVLTLRTFVCRIRVVTFVEQDLIGYSCHFMMDEINMDFTGRSGVKVFFSSDKFPDFVPQIGDKYLLIFNQRGKLQGFQKLDG